MFNNNTKMSFNRQGTMADQAIIVHYSYNSHFQQSKLTQTMNFQRICYKNSQVAFCLVFQFTVNLLGSKKNARITSHRLLVFAPIAFLFWSCILVWKVYTWPTKSVFTTYIGLSLSVSDISYFLPIKMFVSKYTAKIKRPSAQKPGAYWNESLCCPCCPKTFAVNCRTRQNATWHFYNNFTNKI